MLLLLFAVAAVVVVVAVGLITGGTHFYRNYSSVYRSIYLLIIVTYMDLVTLLSFIYMYTKLFVGCYFRDMLGLRWAIIGQVGPILEPGWVYI